MWRYITVPTAALSAVREPPPRASSQPAASTTASWDAVTAALASLHPSTPAANTAQPIASSGPSWPPSQFSSELSRQLAPTPVASRMASRAASASSASNRATSPIHTRPTSAHAAPTGLPQSPIHGPWRGFDASVGPSQSSLNTATPLQRLQKVEMDRLERIARIMQGGR
jgi:hypothetical protein